MRDWKIAVVDDGHGVDIDIIDGEPAYLDYESQTGDQRAALSVYAQKGNLPGALGYGVSWDSQYSRDNTVSQLNNEIQQQVEQYAGTTTSEGVNTSSLYKATLIPQHGNIGVVITRGM